jgi:hypothetical protein
LTLLKEDFLDNITIEKWLNALVTL